MSAAARASGPPEDGAVPPRPRPAPRAVPTGRAAAPARAAAPGRAATPARATGGKPATAGTAATTGRAATTGKPTTTGKTATTGRATTRTGVPSARATVEETAAPGTAPSVARPLRAHTAPVRTGALRARPAARAAAPGPAPRPVPAAASGWSRRGASAQAAGRRAPLVLLVVGLLVATALGLLFLNTAIAVNSLKATQLRAANADRAQEVQRLEQQVISGGTPARLAEDAAAAGLVPAGAAGYLVIGEDGSVTLRGEPAPAEDPADPAGDGD